MKWAKTRRSTIRRTDSRSTARRPVIDRGGSGRAMRYPTTRPPERRVQAIDRALRGGKWPTVQGLAVDLGVDPRTIGGDIRFMRCERNAPIAYDRRRGGYFDREPTYQLLHVPITQGELLAICLSERILRQFRGTPFEAGRGPAWGRAFPQRDQPTRT